MYTIGTRRYIAGAVILMLVARAAWGQEPRVLEPVRHQLEWRDDCLMCHRVGAIDRVPDVPMSHDGRSSETCLWCHAEGAAMLTMVPSTVPHEVEVRRECTLCHTLGRIAAVPDAPLDHEGRPDASCTMCHVPEIQR